MSANFTPEFTTLGSKGAFRFWCQTVLPLVYDDSLSYYELLCKVVAKLNEQIEYSDKTNENVRNLYNAYIALQDYVNHYFDNLDISAEIDRKLDEMVAGGTLLVTSFNGRTGAVVPAAGDYTAVMVGAISKDSVDISNRDLKDILKTNTNTFYRGTGVVNSPNPTYWWYFTIITNADGSYGVILAEELFNSGNLHVGIWDERNDKLEWSKYATTDYAVPLDGSKAMTGALSVGGGYGRFTAASGGTAGISVRSNINDAANYTYIGVYSYEAIAEALKLYRYIDGTPNEYTVLHTGNQPKVSYTGNGSAAARTINTGGLESCCVLYGPNRIAVISYFGGVGFNLSTKTMYYFTDSEANFRMGNLTITTDNEIINHNGTTMYCKVI